MSNQTMLAVAVFATIFTVNPGPAATAAVSPDITATKETEMTATTTDLAMAAERNRKRINAFFDALEALDVQAFGAMLAPDAIYHNPMSIGSAIFREPKQEGRDMIVALFRLLPDLMSKVVIGDRQFDQAMDPDKMFVRTTIAFTFRADGYVYRNDILHVFTFDDDRVATWTEFMDTVMRDRAYGRPGVLGEE